MADGVAITAGSGTTVATDDCGAAGHAQVTKLAISTDGFATLIPADATNGLLVDPRPRAATQVKDSSGLTTSATAYTAGDVLGAGWTFTGMARANGGTGRITGVALLDDGDVLAGADLFIAKASITFGTDNAAPSVSDADAAHLIGSIGVSVVDLGGCRLATAHGLSVPYTCDATSLFVYARTLDSHNFFAAVDDLHLRLFYELD